MGVSPQLHRIPAHLVVLGVVWLALAGLRRLSMNRGAADVAGRFVNGGLANDPFPLTPPSPLGRGRSPGKLLRSLATVTNRLIRCFLWLGRGSLVVVAGILALGCMAVGLATEIFPFFILMSIFGIGALLLLPSTLVGRIAARGGSQRDGDIAMTIFASYVIGIFMPLFY